jgi:hypothetical protein
MSQLEPATSAFGHFLTQLRHELTYLPVTR